MQKNIHLNDIRHFALASLEPVCTLWLNKGCKTLSCDFMCPLSCSTVWEQERLKERRACSASVVEPNVFHWFKGMSYNRGLSEPLPWYTPMAGRLRRTRPGGNRPLSDSDIWAAYLPPPPPFAYRSITDHSCLKVYNKDPAQAFSHGPRPPNGDARVSAPHTCKWSH